LYQITTSGEAKIVALRFAFVLIQVVVPVLANGALHALAGDEERGSSAGVYAVVRDTFKAASYKGGP
jgi:hypothetical protein